MTNKNYSIRFAVFLVTLFLVAVALDKSKFIYAEACMIKLNAYLSTERLSLLLDFFSITIAIYIAITSILAVSVTGIIKVLVEHRISKKLIWTVEWSIGSNVAAIIMLVFLDNSIPYYNLLLLFIVVYAFCHFIYFIAVLFGILKLNVESMPSQIDNDDELRSRIRSTLQTVEDYIMDKLKP